ncbi:MAG: hypothetical protein IPI17_06405 [Nitrosomonas sp.]|nr:hypothetical protein [Nitrosomonas sp.]
MKNQISYSPEVRRNTECRGARIPDRWPDRIQARHETSGADIPPAGRVWKDNFRVYGARESNGGPSCCEKVLVLLVVRSHGLMKKLEHTRCPPPRQKCWTTISTICPATDKVNSAICTLPPAQSSVGGGYFPWFQRQMSFVYEAFSSHRRCFCKIHPLASRAGCRHANPRTRRIW